MDVGKSDDMKCKQPLVNRCWDLWLAIPNSINIICITCAHKKYN